MGRRLAPALLIVSTIGTVACSPSEDGGPPATSAVAAGGDCLVRLHGKGGDGADTTLGAGATIVSPTGNADGWGGRQWLYFPDDRYEEARAVVAESTEGCDRLIVNGFSNGASFAAALYCRGETFDGRLRRVVIDDPVTDGAVADCASDPSVAVTLYWTGALAAQSAPGRSCVEDDWTCAGDTTIGVDAYATALGTEILASPFDEHRWYEEAPELDDFGA